MKKRNKIILSILAIIVIICAIFYKFVISIFMGIMSHIAPVLFPKKDISKATADYTLVANDLYNSVKNDTATTKKYIGKIVLVSGKISNIDTDSHTVTLNDSVACGIDSTEFSQINTHKVGDNIKIQGKISDYNDIFNQVEVSEGYFK